MSCQQAMCQSCTRVNVWMSCKHATHIAALDSPPRAELIRGSSARDALARNVPVAFKKVPIL